YEAAQADFSATPTSGVAPLDVDFTNNSTGDYDTCNWDFGDGGTSSECAPPSYTYNTSGVYTVSLTVSGNGGEDTETKTDYITVYEAAQAAFSATPTKGVAPMDVDFTNTSTGDYDTCSWDFGDGGTSSECAPPTYTYNTPGVYTVSLTVSGNGGEDTETKTDYISVYEEGFADFSAAPTEGIAPLAVDFTNESVGDYDTCSWDFGDGGTSSECAPPTYTYNTPGVYTVSLTISGVDVDDTETKIDYITVYEAAQAEFSATPTSGDAPLDVDFTNQSTGDYDTCSWDFGDGGTSSECAPPTYTYNTPGTYTMALTVSGNGGEDTETKADYITVYEEAQAAFSATPTSGVAPLDVDFTNNSTGDYDTCSWDFGDGGTSSECAPPTYTYSTPGVYTVSLTVSGNGGEDTETKTDYISVFEAAQAEFSATPTSGDAPLDVDFTNQSTGDYDTCSWDFGDSGTSSECTPSTYTYNTPGVYTVVLTVSGNGGEDTETKTDYITVGDPAQAEFSATPTSGVAPLDVDFTNTSTGDYDTCSWDFGDGGMSSECDPPTYTYNTPGTYTVSLTISGGSVEDTETKPDYITVYEASQAEFSATPTSGLAPLDVDFTNNSTGDYDTCSWDFGDGGTSSVCTPPTYTYNTPGTYTVALTVSGNGGEDTETKTDYITVYEVSQADFSATPTSGVAPLDVDFTNNSTGDYDTCSWDFGDSGTSSECAPSTYTYNTPGVYTVVLTVSGNGGDDTETKTDYITVYEEAQAAFSAAPTSGIVPLDVDFTNNSTGDYDTCSWDFGDGGTSSECVPPTYTYSTPGTYTVSLTVSGNGGEDTETKTDYITVDEPAQAAFSATPITGVAPLTVDFDNQSSGDYDTCSWDFGDGGTSSECAPPTYTYNTPGIYTVALTVSGNSGQDTETKTDYITVYEAAQAAFSATPTSGVARLNVDFNNMSSGDYDTCSWDFGDGATYVSCGKLSHIYSEHGVYTVTLTVSGNGGEDTEIKVDYIVVAEYYYNYMPIIMGDNSEAESTGIFHSVAGFLLNLIP
ncbi:MAG: PKD domain-containing protein, partial [Chloroflexota bacterium]|nr:PKD domain-containing protein [Chloroflexota bacterium]